MTLSRATRLAAVCAACCVLGLVSGRCEAGSRSEVIVEPVSKVWTLGGPMGVSVRITNISSRALKYDLSCPDPGGPPPGGLQFDVDPSQKNKIQHKKRDACVIYVGMKEMNIIGAGQSKTMVFYVNRFLSVVKAGRLDLHYRIDLGSKEMEGRIPARGTDVREVFEGVVSVEVVAPSQRDLDAEMHSLVAEFGSAGHQRKVEILEIFSHLDTPRSIQPMKELLKKGFGEAAIVRALGRWNTPEASQAIETMLFHEQSLVVEEAFEQLAKQGKRISSDTAGKILSSKNPSVRYAAFKHLPEVSGPEVASQVERFVADSDPHVAEKAQECLRQLRNKK